MAWSPTTTIRLRALLAMVLIVVGLVISFTLGNRSFVLQLTGIVLIVFAGVVVMPRAKSQYISVQQREHDSALAIKPWLLIVGVGLLVATVATWLWVARAAATGGKSGTPIVVFAFVALLCGLWWVGIFTRWLQRRRNM